MFLHLMAGARNTRRLLTAVLAVLLLNGPLTAAVQAQEGETHVSLLAPSGTSTRGPNLAISDRDMGDHGYELVATVINPPVDPSVVFEVQKEPEEEGQEGEGHQTIGVAEQVTEDTFRLSWVIPAELEAADDWLLAAIVFSGTSEVARDEATVEIDKELPAARLDTHENGGPLGFVQPRSDATWATTLDFTFSQETARVEAFYTLSRPGTEPEWISCGTTAVEAEREEGPSASRLRCELDDADDPSQVTAVGIVSQTCTFFCNTTGLRTIGNQSGDAHRVVPFRATP